jgi:hypothetical protein
MGISFTGSFMSKFKIFVAVITLIFTVVGGISQRYAFACETVNFSNYVKIAPNIFASPDIDNIQQTLDTIAEGKKRVNITFGEMTAYPKIVVVNSKDEATNFGANSTATSHYTPMGTCIILGPKGQNVDVAAHELTHAEIAKRVGWLVNFMEIPIWFNEGVALIVDKREPFLIENIQLSQEEVEAVKQLTSASKFFGSPNTHKNYLASRLAVNKLEPSQLYDKLELIRNGESFSNIFNM